MPLRYSLSLFSRKGLANAKELGAIPNGFADIYSVGRSAERPSVQRWYPGWYRRREFQSEDFLAEKESRSNSGRWSPQIKKHCSISYYVVRSYRYHRINSNLHFISHSCVYLKLTGPSPSTRIFHTRTLVWDLRFLVYPYSEMLARALILLLLKKDNAMRPQLQNQYP